MKDATAVFPTAIKFAGVLFLVSAAAIGWHSSTVAQVAVLSALYSTKDSLVSRMPEFLVGKKYGIDIPIPFLYDGEVVKAVVAETIAFRDIEEKVKPSKRIIQQMETLYKSYGNVMSDLETTTTILITEIHHTSWGTLFAKKLAKQIEAARNKTSPQMYYHYAIPYVSSLSQQWIDGNRSLAEGLHTNETAFHDGDLNTFLYAYTMAYPANGVHMAAVFEQIEALNSIFEAKRDADEFSLQIRISNSEIKIGMKPTDYLDDFTAIDTSLGPLIHMFLPENLVEYTLNEMKLRVLKPRLKSIEDGIVAEKGRELYQKFVRTIDELKLLEDSVMKTAKLFITGCQTNPGANPQCSIAGKLDTDLNRMLMALQTHSYRYPASILQTILKSSRQYIRTELSIRELNHHMRVEEMTNSPNVWLNLAAVSASIGIATFIACLAYQAAWIINYGIIGTLCNLAGVVYDVSASARSITQGHAELAQSRLRIDAFESRESEARASIRLNEALQDVHEAGVDLTPPLLLKG